ncbi:MAG: chorismate mutase [Oscillospiraceae bacterium]|jgi:chorismate mutase/prephenate dehydratase|nr:chorismate mutase [Oscillospiraceae bacterium]
MGLDELRGQIDCVDDEIAGLLQRRMALAAAVAREKQRTGGSVLHKGREQAIIERLQAQTEPQWHTSLRLVYHSLFQASRAHQQRLLAGEEDSPLRHEIAEAVERGRAGFPQTGSVACQGILGAYSHLAAQRLFRCESPNVVFLRTFDAVFRAVEQGLCRYGMLPIENSSYGSVTPVYDLLKKHNCHIVRAVRLPIAHCLLSKAKFLQDVKEIFSHEQALGQCADFLEKLKNVKITVCENTAVAARLAAACPGAAAISSEECAALYGLEVLKRKIQNEPDNETRFICIAAQPEMAPHANKTSVLLSLRHRPGSLAELLQLLAAMDVNLTKLENRPAPSSSGDFEFLFYLDMECDAALPETARFLEEMARQSESFLLLGSYLEETYAWNTH